MKAQDVMVTNVISVGPEASVREVANTLFKTRISAVPVVDGHKQLVGIISEGDLIRRAELETDYRRSWWLKISGGKRNEVLAIEYARSHAREVKDLMTQDVITAKPTTPLREIAALLEKNRIKRIPIVSKGKVVGIVSRADLIQVLASLSTGIKPAAVNDLTIRKRIMARFKSEDWSKHCILSATVQGGNVKLWGVVDSEAEKEVARMAVELVAGVRTIENNVIVLSSN